MLAITKPRAPLNAGERETLLTPLNRLRFAARSPGLLKPALDRMQLDRMQRGSRRGFPSDGSKWSLAGGAKHWASE
jgi:hypothetical protein